jgi:zinc-binding alcohol dehydrogenase family protein
MKAVAYRHSLPIDHADSLLDITLPEPVVSGRDLLVKIESIAVNPVDTKVRLGVDPKGSDKVLGWDAAGIVQAVGPEVSLFKPGDAVYYAGALERSGSNAELQLVDERIVGRKPTSLSFAEAAALPLTAITAWELLFDRLALRLGKPSDQQSMLIVGGAGGVGSIATQLARRLTGLKVIATASTPESQAWCRQMGAHHVINHREALVPQIQAIVPGGVDYVLALTQTDQHFNALAEALAPQGKIACIDDPSGPLDIKALKRKSGSFHWEFMFTRAMFQTQDMIAQHRLLNEVADLVDAGVLKTTFNGDFGRINAANLKRAHAQLEGGRSIGKIVLSGF